MLLFKYLLRGGGISMMALAASILAYDLRREGRNRRGLETAAPVSEIHPWRTQLALAILAWTPMLLALSLLAPQAQWAPANEQNLVPAVRPLDQKQEPGPHERLGL